MGRLASRGVVRQGVASRVGKRRNTCSGTADSLRLEMWKRQNLTLSGDEEVGGRGGSHAPDLEGMSHQR